MEPCDKLLRPHEIIIKTCMAVVVMFVLISVSELFVGIKLFVLLASYKRQNFAHQCLRIYVGHLSVPSKVQ